MEDFQEAGSWKSDFQLPQEQPKLDED